MNKNGMNVNKDIESDVVKSLIDVNAINNVGTTSSNSMFNKYLNKIKCNKKVLIGGIILIVIVIIIGFLLLNNKKKVEEEKKLTIYEEAYKNMEFNENKDLKKLKCSKKTTGEDLEIQEEETKVYYFNGNEIDTYILHNYVSLSEEYEDYFSTMYNEYKKSITNDYKYDNVKTGLTDRERELLITVIVDNKSTSENKLGTPAFINYEDAKKSLIDNGYVCE